MKISKVVIGLKSPACDIIGQIHKDNQNLIILKNPCMFTWLGDYMKIIPFEAISDEFEIPVDNIAWRYEINEKVSKAYDDVVKKWNKDDCQLLTKKEYDDKLISKQNDIKNTLKKVK